MPQTFLALLGIMLASTLSLSEQRHHALTVSTVVGIESDVTAAGIGEDYLDAIGTLAFDDATADGPISSAIALTALSTLPVRMDGRFTGSTSQSVASLDAVGLNGASSLNDLLGANVEVSRQADQADRSFSIETVVGYVSEADGATPSAVPTKLKLVSARITPLDVSGSDGVVLSRLYSCGGSCDW